MLPRSLLKPSEQSGCHIDCAAASWPPSRAHTQQLLADYFPTRRINLETVREAVQTSKQVACDKHGCIDERGAERRFESRHRYHTARRAGQWLESLVVRTGQRGRVGASSTHHWVHPEQRSQQLHQHWFLVQQDVPCPARVLRDVQDAPLAVDVARELRLHAWIQPGVPRESGTNGSRSWSSCKSRSKSCCGECWGGFPHQSYQKERQAASFVWHHPRISVATSRLPISPVRRPPLQWLFKRFVSEKPCRTPRNRSGTEDHRHRVLAWSNQNFDQNRIRSRGERRDRAHLRQGAYDWQGGSKVSSQDVPYRQI